MDGEQDVVQRVRSENRGTVLDNVLGILTTPAGINHQCAAVTSSTHASDGTDIGVTPGGVRYGDPASASLCLGRPPFIGNVDQTIAVELRPRPGLRNPSVHYRIQRCRVARAGRAPIAR